MQLDSCFEVPDRVQKVCQLLFGPFHIPFVHLQMVPVERNPCLYMCNLIGASGRGPFGAAELSAKPEDR